MASTSNMDAWDRTLWLVLHADTIDEATACLGPLKTHTDTEETSSVEYICFFALWEYLHDSIRFTMCVRDHVHASQGRTPGRTRGMSTLNKILALFPGSATCSWPLLRRRLENSWQIYQYSAARICQDARREDADNTSRSIRVSSETPFERTFMLGESYIGIYFYIQRGLIHQQNALLVWGKRKPVQTRRLQIAPKHELDIAGKHSMTHDMKHTTTHDLAFKGVLLLLSLQTACVINMEAGTSVHGPYRKHYRNCDSYQGARSLGARGTPTGIPKELRDHTIEINALNTQTCSHRTFLVHMSMLTLEEPLAWTTAWCPAGGRFKCRRTHRLTGH